MPTCKKCNMVFGHHQIVNGKERNLQRRKYCLECSPFGTRGTLVRGLKRKEQKSMGIPFTCSICGKSYVYKRGSGHTFSKCNSCSVNFYRKKKKDTLLKIAGGSCSLCGYSKCKWALTFHHLYGQEKEFAISGNHCRKLSSLKEEIKKCILVCENCHREIHYGIHVDKDLSQYKVTIKP